jgi:glycosyltransferase involved in cell wall biosynthesis
MHICNIFPQFRSLAGGERLILKLCEESIRMGHRVSLLTLSMDKSCRPRLDKKIYFRELIPRLNLTRNHYLKVLFEHLLVYKIVRAIPKDADVICFHRSASLPALYYYKKKTGKRLIYYCYEPPRFAYDLQKETIGRLGLLAIPVKITLPIFRIIDKKLTRTADKILVFNNYMRSWIFDLYKKDPLVVGPLAVDTERFSHTVAAGPFRQRWDITEKDHLILTINKLHERKRIDILIQAMARVVQKLPNTKLVIVGTGPEANNLKRLASSLGLNGVVIFTGHLPEAELIGCYSASDLYVNLAKNEPFGLAVIEAQAFGLPVITVAEGGPRESIIDGITGRFVKPELEGLTTAIVDLLKDKITRRNMGEAAQKNIIENYSWRAAAARFIQACLS